MPNLVPPKIPDGERVDFDVSGGLGRAGPLGESSGPPGGGEVTGGGHTVPDSVLGPAPAALLDPGPSPLAWGQWAASEPRPPAGHPPEAHGEGPERAADAD